MPPQQITATSLAEYFERSKKRNHGVNPWRLYGDNTEHVFLWRLDETDKDAEGQPVAKVAKVAKDGCTTIASRIASAWSTAKLPAVRASHATPCLSIPCPLPSLPRTLSLSVNHAEDQS